MAWMKRKGQSTPSPATVPPPVQMFNPNQHSNQETQWQAENAATNWYNQPAQQKQYGYNQQPPQQNYWQQAYNTPVNQPQAYTQNTNQYQQNPYSQQQVHPQNQGYYQNYQQQTYGNGQYNQQPQQQHYGYNEAQNNTYGQQQQQQQHIQQNDADSWNWGWGDEDNSNLQSLPSQNTESSKPAHNNISESFANDETWNWSVDDASNATASLNCQKTDAKSATSKTNMPEHGVVDESGESVFPKMGKLAERHRNSKSEIDPENHEFQQAKPESEQTYEPPSTVENMPAGVTGKRNNKMDHLTPQWSIESQMSQDSSDDVLHTSESDKSRMLSRSSTISQSPISGQDPNLETVAQVPVQDLATNNVHEALPKEEQPYYEQNPPNFENVEIPFMAKESRPENIALKKNATPPPPMKNLTPPLMPPPVSGNGDDNKNPYKRSTALTHKAASKLRTTNVLDITSNYFPTQSNFAPPFNQLVNLETVPDNSEQPDTIPQPVRKVSQTKPAMHYPENNEVAPINDRNQYLETGQLSDESTNNMQADALPPPGLRRMVLGQMEHNDGDLNAQGGLDEPPPGLSRMVLGQTESSSSIGINQSEIDSRQYDSSGPPAGLHRMIPGESSSPESTNRHQYSSMTYPDIGVETREDDYISETELNQLVSHITPPMRSATIGADTPPTVTNTLTSNVHNIVNRSETIGAHSAAHDNARISASNSVENRIGAIGLDTQDRDTNLTGANNSDQMKIETRRESIEGQPQETEMANLVASVRDLTVGENPTDGATSATSAHEPSRRHSRQESSDSDHDHDGRGKSPRDRRERRYKEKDDRRERDKGRNRDRYSPDSYRDKKYDRRRYRDRRYEEDTDYYSDKERRNADNRDRRDDYDRKYNSLRRDKEKDKKRRDPRDPREYPRDGRRSDYYYRHYDDGYDEESRNSRPTSRSDSLHDSYRERGHERDHRRHMNRERDHQRRHRDQFNYMQGYGYDPYNQYYQQYQYQYYENLRRTNPQAYAEWYRKYYQQAAATTGTYGTEDRASVHSGRSSVNDELSKDRYTRQSYYSQASLPHMSGYYREPNSISSHYGMDESRPFEQTDSSLNFEDNTTMASQRMTPAKFSTAHVKVSLSGGKFVKILPHYPLDGQTASVQVGGMDGLLVNDDEYRELTEFPGPLVKGVTHKKTIIEYCENKIKNAVNNAEMSDPESYILMWELLILLLRQNGVVVGTDIAELLMKGKGSALSKRSQSISSNGSAEILEEPSPDSGNVQSEVVNSPPPALKEEIVTNKFREYLIYGSEKEALEWAMKHGLWGHALFLASKLDKRTYANVMTRFANGLTMNDPLQTLYQLLSGRVPAAVTCVADEKWGDWRPHLAMILSNTSQRPELDLKAITTLGDTLMNRGSFYAAQFCYIMAQVNFSRYGAEGAKLVLLGANHNKPFVQFATNEAIHMTEVYEYARSLNDGSFVLPEFQAYKYLLATRLADRGLLETALGYLERVSISIIQNAPAAQPSLVNRICVLADRLKYNDPVAETDDSAIDGDPDSSRPDNSWLKDLKKIQQDFNMGLITHESVNNLADATPDYESFQPPYYEPQLPQPYQQGSWQSNQQIDQPQVDYQKHEQPTPDVYSNQYPEQQQYWGQTQYQWGGNETLDQKSSVNQYNQPENQLDQKQQQQQQHDEYWNNTQIEQGEVEQEKTEDAPRPQITMPNQPTGKSPYDEEDDEAKDEKNAANAQMPSPAKSKSANALKQDKPVNSGWFGGIWNRLALRPKNQMKLPDDKNPTIVWDPEKKKWVNTEEDNSESSNELKPPPKMSDMFPGKVQTPSPPVASLPPPGIDQQQITEQLYQMPSAPVINQNAYSGLGQASLPAPVQNTSTSLRNGAGSGSNGGQEESKPSLPSQHNMFKLQRGRNLKKSYVDVFNPSGKPSANASSLPPPDAFGMVPPAQPQMNFFIPQPVTDPNAPINFLTPAPVNIDNSQQNNQPQ